MSQPQVAAVVEVELDGRLFASPPVPLVREGGRVLAVVEKEGDGRVLKVRVGPAPAPGVVQFEKTCAEPVRIVLLRDDEAFQELRLAKLFEGVNVEIAPAFA